MRQRIAVLVVLVSFSLLPFRPATAALQGYVDKPDETYRHRLVDRQAVAGGQAYVVRMQSQAWRGQAWRHWLTILVPNKLEHEGKAVLVVAAGNNHSDAPVAESAESHMIAAAAGELGVPVAILHQVPNQPLFDGMYEDAAIAHTFERYLRAGGDWPLLLPMVKSVVRAMDTVEQVLSDEHGLAIDGYVVSGASKRGWAAWLAAAVDDRIEAIAPMIIDMLHFAPQMRQQQATYGRTSPMIEDYRARGLIAALDTVVGRRLTDLVDPYAYRDALTLPKLILLGTNDPYWTVDAANLYLDELEGPTHVIYEPNAGHGLSASVSPTLVAFVRRVFAGRSMPELHLERETKDEGDPGRSVRLRASWSEPATTVTLWRAVSPNRDFRQARWQPEPVPVKNGVREVEVMLEAPAGAWVAGFVQVRFEGDQPFVLSTPMTVWPRDFPYEQP